MRIASEHTEDWSAGRIREKEGRRVRNKFG
jgi:hypothetical protein